MKKRFYSVLGAILVVLGAVGMVVPLLPTTPFLLLAGYLFAQSSDRMNQWLLTHRFLGPYIHAFRSNQGVTITQKVRIGISLTITMGVGFYFAPVQAVKYTVAGIWLFWCFMLYRMKTAASPTFIDP